MDRTRKARGAFVLVLVLVLLAAGTCAAARPVPTMATLPLPSPPHDPRHHRPHKTAFRHRGSIFNYLPRGSTVPPSGPSLWHNSATASAPGT
ncbi:hypothetical protein BT93_D1900 [Corymbia citriodora subsp. variegata]|nr:hypothetical protein BT93_D1900 [Corymbia citriodora subsp. variegata]